MTITAQITSNQLSAFLRHDISLEQLVDWAELAFMDGEIPESEVTEVSEVLTRLGLADVKAFALTWQDCGEFLHKLGYVARVEVTRL